MAEKSMPYDLLEYNPEAVKECVKCPSTEFTGPTFGTIKGLECLIYTCTKCGYQVRMKTKDAHLYKPVTSAPGGTPPTPPTDKDGETYERGKFTKRGADGESKEIKGP
jgi:Zn ribbon nucleic-acid-binding protein